MGDRWWDAVLQGEYTEDDAEWDGAKGDGEFGADTRKELGTCVVHGKIVTFCVKLGSRVFQFLENSVAKRGTVVCNDNALYNGCSMTTPSYVQRMRVQFGKRGAARWIGHLDLARTWERSLNRAGVPMAYTQGFNRRPRMQFANALPLGYTSDCELIDLWLRELSEPEQIEAMLNERMAPGIDVHWVKIVPIPQPKLPSLTREAIFRAELVHVPVDKNELKQKIEQFLAADEVIAHKKGGKNKGKPYNMRPLVLDLALDDAADMPTIVMRFVTKEGGQMGRPDQMLKALGYDSLDVRIHRTAIILEESINETEST